MNRLNKLKEHGFSTIETGLMVVIAIVIIGVGYLVYHEHHKIRTTNNATALQPLTTSSKSSGSSTGSTASNNALSGSSDNNANLEQDLNSVNAANNQDNQNLSSANGGLNDQSTFTSY